LCAAVAAIAVLSSTHESRAGDDLRWREEWARFRVSEAVVTGVAAATVATLYIIPRHAPTWGRPILFDSTFRDAWKTNSESTKTLAGTWSTWGYYGLLAYPLLVDGAIAAGRGGTDLALQTTLINLEAFAVSAFVFRVTEATVRRARPYVYECIQRTGSYEQCKESGLGGTNSFVSGHVAIAATGAGLMCTHHLNLKLYGAVGSPIACGVAIAATLGVGYGRIVSDNHYMTDVLSGMIVGGLSGWLVPSLLHYGLDGKGTKKLGSIPMPYASHDTLGLQWIGLL
jgi:membrane-associated phospholipid phosphatase